MSIKVENNAVWALIDALVKAELKTGQRLKVVGGHTSDDIGINRVVIVNTNGEDWEHYGGVIEGVYFE